MTLPADTPTSLPAFARRFKDERSCARHLADLRWPGGFRCRHCDGRDAWQLEVRPRVFECRGCGSQNSVTAGTVMHRSKVPLTEWFWAAWLFAQDKRGVSALQLSRQLGRRYETVWRLLHKLRVALAEDDSVFPLRGVVEVDEAYVGGKARRGEGGRSLKDHRRSLVVCAVERHELPPTRVGIRGTGLAAGAARLRALPRAGKEELTNFLGGVCAPRATVRSDGWKGYAGLPNHETVVVGDDASRASDVLPIVHTVFSNLQAWLVGTFHGVSRLWLPRYLQEFTWRFNRRTHQPQLCSYLLRRAMRKPWVQHVQVLGAEPLLQGAA